MDQPLPAWLNPDYLFSTAFLFLLLKGMFLIGLGVYVIFAIVLVRQIAIMSRTVKTGTDFIFTILGFAHLALAILVWGMAFVTL